MGMSPRSASFSHLPRTTSDSFSNPKSKAKRRILALLFVSVIVGIGLLISKFQSQPTATATSSLSTQPSQKSRSMLDVDADTGGENVPWSNPGNIGEDAEISQFPDHKILDISNWDNGKVLLAAATGVLEYVKAEFERVGDVIVKTADSNGWLPLHEASRTGSLEVVSYLVEVGGADINAVTKNQLTAAVIAKDFLGEDSEMVKLLVALGAKEL